MRSLLITFALVAVFAAAVTAQWTVTVVAKPASHPQFGVGQNVAFVLNGIHGLELNVTVGDTVTFYNNHGSIHPFYLTTSVVGKGASVYSDGVSGPFAPYGHSQTTLTWNVMASAPTLLYYACKNHPNMGWKINVLCPEVTCPASSCGTITNACGKSASCGSCGSGQVCNNNMCECDPVLDECPANSCGSIDNGCGSLLSCGGCAGPHDACESNVCVCQPLTQCPFGSCGMVSDNCGGWINCGSCCVPDEDECDGMCGTITDSCGDPMQCGSCAAGKKCTNMVCVNQCTAGNYPSGTLCKQCPAGTVSAAGDAECMACPQGSYSLTKGATSCMWCGPGNYSTGGGIACKPCAKGSISTATGTGMCTLCPAGTNQPMDGQTSCVSCAAGTKSSLCAGATACTNCPAGQSSAMGSSICMKCMPGQYNGVAGGLCMDCPPNTYSVGGATTCTACPANTKSTAGSFSRASCLPTS